MGNEEMIINDKIKKITKQLEKNTCKYKDFAWIFLKDNRVVLLEWILPVDLETFNYSAADLLIAGICYSTRQPFAPIERKS